MLKLTIAGAELFDEETATFSTFGDLELSLEHSLFSMSKWESKFQKPFLVPGEKTNIEIIEYIKMMIITPDCPLNVLSRFNQENITQINEYIESPQSATTFPSNQNQSGSREVITSELIYYWMVAYKIPFECQNWHLNRLFALIRICSIKNSKQKKMSPAEIARRNRELNNQRRAQLKTTG